MITSIELDAMARFALRTVYFTNIRKANNHGVNLKNYFKNPIFILTSIAP